MSNADSGRRVPPHGSGPASLPPAPNRGEGTAVFVDRCPLCSGTHKDRYPGACAGPPLAPAPPHRMMG